MLNLKKGQVFKGDQFSLRFIFTGLIKAWTRFWEYKFWQYFFAEGNVIHRLNSVINKYVLFCVQCLND